MGGEDDRRVDLPAKSTPDIGANITQSGDQYLPNEEFSDSIYASIWTLERNSLQGDSTGWEGLRGSYADWVAVLKCQGP